MVTCHGAGTPYTSADNPGSVSPDCGHTYTRAVEERELPVAVGLIRRGMPTNAVAPAAIQINLTRHMPQEELSERGWLDSGGNRVNRPGPEWKTIEQRAARLLRAVRPGPR
jgi:hypothetical protein